MNWTGITLDYFARDGVLYDVREGGKYDDAPAAPPKGKPASKTIAELRAEMKEQSKEAHRGNP